jgi:peptidoglycan/LPS O-acetylase OafA/YrhL
MNKNTRFITGLKALGAIMVVISHLKMQFSGYTDFSWKFINFSSYFIVLFICISAFTISMSIERKTQFHFLSYMKRRWERLAPSYYIVLIIGLAVKTMINGWKFFPSNVQNLFYDFAFLNLDPINKGAQAAILGVEWMLPIMFWCYVLIPIFLFSARRIYSLFLILFALSIFLHFNPTVFTNYTGFGGAGWSIQFYIVMYTYTILIYILHTKHIDWQKSKRVNLIIAGLGTLVGCRSSYII